jgi:hypothetical protein
MMGMGKSKTLNVLLGAGFSVDAGVPMVSEINTLFDRDLLGQLCSFSDSQWRWLEYQDEAGKHNGRLNRIVEAHEFIFNQLVKSYINDSGSFKSYEAFYSFLLSKERIWFKNACEKAKQEEINLRIKKGISVPEGDYWDTYNNYDNDKPIEILNYLVADSLRWKEMQFERLESYMSFLKFIAPFDSVNFFTLNHDGFTKLNSDILGSKKQTLNTFKNSFNAPLKIYKLHGGKDHYAFETLVKGGHIYHNTGDKVYFKIDEYLDLHRCSKINLKTGQIGQDFNSNVVPQFLTGSIKKQLIENDFMYANMYKAFIDQMKSENQLLIIGYSFCDEHINSVLENCHSSRIINVNPEKRNHNKLPAAINLDFTKDLVSYK